MNIKGIVIISTVILNVQSCKVKEHQVTEVNPRDYQIEIFMDTISVYDGERLVGKSVTNWNTSLDTLIMDDNQ